MKRSPYSKRTRDDLRLAFATLADAAKEQKDYDALVALQQPVEWTQTATLNCSYFAHFYFRNHRENGSVKLAVATDSDAMRHADGIASTRVGVEYISVSKIDKANGSAEIFVAERENGEWKLRNVG